MRLIATATVAFAFMAPAAQAEPLTKKERRAVVGYVRSNCTNFLYKNIIWARVTRDHGAKWFTAKCHRNSNITADNEIWAWYGNINYAGGIYIARKWKVQD